VCNCASCRGGILFLNFNPTWNDDDAMGALYIVVRRQWYEHCIGFKFVREKDDHDDESNHTFHIQSFIFTGLLVLVVVVGMGNDKCL
jgi:hypothetical protein